MLPKTLVSASLTASGASLSLAIRMIVVA